MATPRKRFNMMRLSVVNFGSIRCLTLSNSFRIILNIPILKLEGITMGITTKVWNLNGTKTSELKDFGFELESHLEDIICHNIKLVSEDWLLIGRQVQTDSGFLDLLAIDRNGDLIVLELKKDRTSRDVIAQALDYGSWVRHLESEDIVEIFKKFQSKYHSNSDERIFDNYFKDSFGVELPESLNSSHSLVVVAASMDDSNERIVNYLEEYYEVNINFILLRTFQDGERKYITKTWYHEPSSRVEKMGTKKSSSWNGEFYVSFGENDHRSWEDAVEYGFISAGGGAWYSQTLAMLKPGDRIWVNIPKVGYVGVGEVVATAKPLRETEVLVNGSSKKIVDLNLRAGDMTHDLNDDELCEHVVPVKWIDTRLSSNPIKEVGLFGNQNSVCKPIADTWVHTIKRLDSLLHKSKKAA